MSDIEAIKQFLDDVRQGGVYVESDGRDALSHCRTLLAELEAARSLLNAIGYVPIAGKSFSGYAKKDWIKRRDKLLEGEG